MSDSTVYENHIYERWKNLIKSQSHRALSIFDFPIGTMLEIDSNDWIVTRKNEKDRRVTMGFELYCVQLSQYSMFSYADLWNKFIQNRAKILHVPPEEIKE